MNEKVIDALNKARAAEMTAILQYMAHHYELEDAAYGKLAKKLKATAIVEMKHAEMLAERILFLGGKPVSKFDSEIKKGQTIPELLETDRALEKKAIDMYNDFSALCAAEKDQVSKELFDTLVKQEEEHWDDFDNIKSHVDDLGNVYIATLADGAAE
jgi:bacterioferritin